MPLFVPGFAQGAIQGQEVMAQRQAEAQRQAAQKQTMDYQAWQMQQQRQQAATQLQAQQGIGPTMSAMYPVPPVGNAQPNGPAPAPAPGSNSAQQAPTASPGSPPPPSSAGSQPQGNPVPAYRTVANTSAPTGQPQGQGGGPMAVPPVQSQQQPNSGYLERFVAAMRASNKPESEWGAQLEAVAPGIKMAMADDAEKLKAQGVQFNEQLKTILAQLQADKLAGQEANWKSEDERRKKITAKEAAELAIKARKAAGAGSAGGVGGKADESIGPEVATGKPLNQIIPGYGGKDTAIQRRNARSAGIDEIMKQTGISRADAGAELALRNIEYNSGKTTDSKMALMEGTTRQAVKQLDFNVNAVNKEMAKLKSTDALPILNALARGVEKWDGDPAYSSLFYYMNAAATESARILSGGTGSVAQLHQGAMEEAQKWANMNMTPAMWKSVATAMQEEGQARLDTYKEARSSSRLGNTNTGGQSASGPKKIANDADYNALPSGAEFIAPDGSHRKKP